MTLANDANCATHAEATVGSAKGAKNAVVITIGTGLGGGIIIDGRPYFGLSGAGELGHMVICEGGRKCGCGRRGCWETYATAPGLNKTTAEIMRKHPDSLLWALCVGLVEKLDGRVVFEAYRANDPAALLSVGKYIQHLALGIVNIINILEPDVFSIGGGVSGAWDCMEAPLKAAIEVEKFMKHSTHTGQTELVRAALGNDAGMVGAALLGREAALNGNK